MEFKWMTVVLLHITLTNVVCGKMAVKDSLSKKGFVKLDTETYSQKTHAIMSIQSEDGDIIDGIDIYKQPAFDHPALKHHKIQMNPSYDVQAETTADDKQRGRVTGQTWQRSGSCPKGTIPIRRIRNNNVTKTNGNVNDSKTLNLLQKNHSVAILQTEGFTYFGAKGVIKVWNPRVEYDDEYSTSQVALKGGHYTEYEVMESGWAVNPSVYGDRQTRLFVYWTDFTEPTSDKLLPDLHPLEQHVFTLVLDLNETLIYSDWKCDRGWRTFKITFSSHDEVEAI